LRIYLRIDLRIYLRIYLNTAPNALSASSALDHDGPLISGIEASAERGNKNAQARSDGSSLPFTVP
jgi:hypothetical protein